jgi:hypothetical protein
MYTLLFGEELFDQEFAQQWVDFWEYSHAGLCSSFTAPHPKKKIDR